MNARIILAVVAITGAAGLLGSDTAHAVRVGGHAAIISSSDESCTALSYAALTNNCGSTITYTTPLPVETSGNKALSFRGSGATSDNDVECRGQAMNDAHTGYWATAWTSMPAFGSVQDVSLGNLHVGGDGAAYMRCKVDDGATLISMEWAQ
ncbi:hypothetical protein [Paraliomyxa miuraensis]|uniref:hypothetical protein n=1 Tax=Paraliomyxa miuraensis TaxID=376150 RepID=UPI00224F9768|nr:hypothetical protein [Paraliomyxa miuraensis]MCX4244997.1 hypothetical protein [Paraliomyxa miuraensis]